MSDKRAILLTGPPGIGKTRTLNRTVKELQKDGRTVGGMISYEVREEDNRVGFEIVNLTTNQRGWLAHVNQPTGPKIGKYRVNLKDLNQIGANSIFEAIQTSDVITVDEIGPMELTSFEFKNAVIEAIKSNKPFLGTIHYRLNTALIEEIKTRKDTEIVEITLKNRSTIHNLIADKINKYLH